MVTAPIDQPYSILIADDEAVYRESLRNVFEPQGFRTILSSSGEEAVEIVQAEPVHLALLDMHMPRLTGLETLRLVKQIKAFLPVIILTADTSEILLQEALKAHAFSVVGKPVSKELITYLVTRALRRTRAQG